MAVEIERKFLVNGEGWRRDADPGQRIVQGYLATGSVQVRIRRTDHRAYLTIKGPRAGISRAEFEYEIPAGDAESMIAALCPLPPIEKTRHEVRHGEHVWEVDVYEGRHAGLVVAEVELDQSEEHVALPDWLGREVTGDRRYSNVVLVESETPDS